MPRWWRRRTKRAARRSGRRSGLATNSSTSVRRLLADAATPRTGPALPDPALGGQREEQLHRLAGPPTDRAHEGRRPRPSNSIIVVTDRRILDRQIRDTIKQYAQVGATVEHAERSGDLRRFIEGGKKIIISTVQKFPFILAEIGNEQRTRRFAIIIDEAHSSQGGRYVRRPSRARWGQPAKRPKTRPSRTASTA